MDDLARTFAHVFGVIPFEFQLRVAQLLLQGRSVILHAPTGSGKTRTAFFPFLHAWRLGLPFPRKCLYAVPLRVLATQFLEDAQGIGPGWGESQPRITLQTGEQQNDRTFEGDLIFTTIDQVLSSVLNVPYSLSRRRANLNAGAVLSSFLVADEVHLFPLDEARGQGALATMVELLAEFGETVPFLLMTATLSQAMLAALSKQLDAEVVKPTEADLTRLHELKPRVRRFHVRDEPLTAERILAGHSQRTIVVCNQVERATNLYEDLLAASRPADRDGKVDVKLLHSRFLKPDRQGIEEWVRQHFGEGAKGRERPGGQILVSSQAIEVGLHISCERLHTELAPANSIVQRAGRCARFVGEQGDVILYRLPEGEGNPYLPYDRARCEATWSEFAARDNAVLTFADEQAIVAKVHDPSDLRTLQKVADQRATRWEQISRAMHQGKTEFRPNLIRRVDSRTVLVSGKPEEEVKRPFAWEGFSVFHGTLRGWVKRLQETTDQPLPDWWLKYPIEVLDSDQDGRRQVSYRWEVVVDPAQIDVAPLFVAHPDLVAYDGEHGFRLVPGERRGLERQAPSPQPIADRLVPSYTLEVLGQHTNRMLDVYRRDGRRFRDQFIQACMRLSWVLENAISLELLERALLLAFLLHDVAKCEVRWQAWARAYQQAIGEPVVDSSAMVVHTHYRPAVHLSHRQAEESLAQLRRPPHAAEGAFASWPVIWEALGHDELLCPAVFSAIARHHGPQVESFGAYELDKACVAAVSDVLDQAGLDGPMASRLTLAAEPESLRAKLIQPDWPAQWAAYALIVRMLRLCDGHSLEEE